MIVGDWGPCRSSPKHRAMVQGMAEVAVGRAGTGPGPGDMCMADYLGLRTARAASVPTAGSAALQLPLPPCAHGHVGSIRWAEPRGRPLSRGWTESWEAQHTSSRKPLPQGTLTASSRAVPCQDPPPPREKPLMAGPWKARHVAARCANPPSPGSTRRREGAGAVRDQSCVQRNGAAPS